MVSGRLIDAYREGFGLGETRIVNEDDTHDSVRFDFAIHRLGAGERVDGSSPTKESVWVLMDGEAEVTCEGAAQTVRRTSLFDDPPTAVHISAGGRADIASRGTSEWAVARATNGRRFETRIFSPDELRPEFRGKGLVQDMCLRNVRLIFDLDERPDSNLVIGEVVNYPGRWSSFPPHHHPQPELYHYRFTEPQGYGHAELGEHVLKVRSYDSIKIMGGEGHSQCSAPGYGMYYLWVIRHLEGRPYRGFEFEPEHRWLLNPENQGWSPRE